MTRPAWLPTGNEVAKNLVMVAIVGAIVYLWRQQQQRRP